MTDEFIKDSLHAIVFCGPNGSGKTSLIEQIKATGLATLNGTYPMPKHFINPDQVAKDLGSIFPDQRAKDLAAFNAAVKMRNEAIASKQPFAYETVMSHPSRINEMLRLKEQGYTLLVTFITTDHADKNVARVKQRFATKTTTGHSVPEITVRERYQRTLSLLPKAVEIADGARIYDNSIDFQNPLLQVVCESNVRFDIAPNAKQWVIEKLIEPLHSRGNDVKMILDAFKSNQQPVGLADELRGSYAGEVVLATKNFVVQYDEQTKQAVIHDRLMLDTAPESNKNKELTYTRGKSIEVCYSQENAPVVDHKMQFARTELSQSTYAVIQKIKDIERN